MRMNHSRPAATGTAVLVAAFSVLLGCQPQEADVVVRSFEAPADVGDGWLTASPGEVGLDEAPLRELAARLDRDKNLNVHAVLVIKDERLVYEQYFEGSDQDWGSDLGHVTFDRDTLHDLRSVSKSVTSSLVGIAQAEGLVPGVETGLIELFPEHSLAPEKNAVTLRSILTMSAGFEWDETIPYNDPRNSEIQMIRSPDPIRYVLEQEVVDTPGTTYNYSGGLTTLLAGLIERTSGKPIAEYARTALFDPLGITEFEWRKNDNGMHAAASGLRLKPRDLAKFGYLYLNNGEWQGTRVLPGEWVVESTQPYSKPSWTVGYGYQWWIQRFASDERVIDVPAALGLGGQRIFVVPQLQLLVVINSGNYNSTDPAHSLLSERLLAEYVFAAAGVAGAEFVEG